MSAFARLATLVCEDRMSSVIDDYLVDPKVSLLEKTRMQAQVLVPVLRALRAELGKDKADALVKQALRLVEAVVRRNWRSHRGQPAAQMGGRPKRLRRGLGQRGRGRNS